MNQLITLMPYHDGTAWVFDDPARGLLKEPFVMGIPEMIQHLTAGIPNAKQGFQLIGSQEPFPDYQQKLVRVRPEHGGWWYATENPPQEGWLCPALFKYFEKAPEQLYVQAKPLPKGVYPSLAHVRAVAILDEAQTAQTVAALQYLIDTLEHGVEDDPEAIQRWQDKATQLIQTLQEGR